VGGAPFFPPPLLLSSSAASVAVILEHVLKDELDDRQQRLHVMQMEQANGGGIVA